MSYGGFEVDITALGSGVAGHQRMADEIRKITDLVANPDPMMLGFFAQPIISWGTELATNATRSLVNGVATGEANFGANLENTQKMYQETEEFNESLVGKIMGL